MGQDAEDNTGEVYNDLIAYLMEITSDFDVFPPVFARQKDVALITETLASFAAYFGVCC